MGEKMIAIPRHSACALTGVLQSCLGIWKENADMGSPDQSLGIRLLSQAIGDIEDFVDNGQSEEGEEVTLFEKEKGHN